MTLAACSPIRNLKMSNEVITAIIQFLYINELFKRILITYSIEFRIAILGFNILLARLKARMINKKK